MYSYLIMYSLENYLIKLLNVWKNQIIVQFEIHFLLLDKETHKLF